ncbi:MAG TPA: alpha/beta hydrolase [Bacteroidales bacterium]|nr:alpha/beta hydrolase [Bacteroidales bacterium]
MKKYFHHLGKKIYYSEYGSGPAIVLIHGYLETSDIWESFAVRLADGYKVLAIDLPGHGGSDVYSGTHTMEFMAEVTERLLFATGTEKAFLTGHSMGGYVTLAFLEKFPHKLTGYCLFHSHPFADTREVKERRKNDITLVESGRKFMLVAESVRKMYANDNLEKFKTALEKSKSIAGSIRPEGITAVLKGMMERPSRLHLMENESIPFLWILGAKDNYIDSGSMKNRVKMPAGSELHILENSGHMGFIEEEEKSAAIIHSFVKGIG